MASPNAPKTSEQLIREHSTARYITRNLPSWYGDQSQPMGYAKSAVDQQARKYR